MRVTIDYAIFYQGKPETDKKINVHGVVNSDWARDLNHTRSTSGYMFMLFGGAVSWMNRRHSVTTLLTIEAENMATNHARKEVFWLQWLCSEFGFQQKPVRLDCDSQSAIFLAKNHVYHSKKKHIDVRYHFVRDVMENKKVLLEKVDTLKTLQTH